MMSTSWQPDVLIYIVCVHLKGQTEKRLFEGVAGDRHQQGKIFGLTNMFQVNAKATAFLFVNDIASQPVIPCLNANMFSVFFASVSSQVCGGSFLDEIKRERKHKQRNKTMGMAVLACFVRVRDTIT